MTLILGVILNTCYDIDDIDDIVMKRNQLLYQSGIYEMRWINTNMPHKHPLKMCYQLISYPVNLYHVLMLHVISTLMILNILIIKLYHLLLTDIIIEQ